MLIFVCDICGKRINDRNQAVNVEQGFYKRFSFCDACSKPIHIFLKKSGLIKKEISRAKK